MQRVNLVIDATNGYDQAMTEPPMGRRERILTPSERRVLFGGIRDKAFKLFVFSLVSTGARPSEIRRVTTTEFLPGMWVFPPK